MAQPLCAQPSKLEEGMLPRPDAKDVILTPFGSMLQRTTRPILVVLDDIVDGFENRGLPAKQWWQQRNQIH